MTLGIGLLGYRTLIFPRQCRIWRAARRFRQTLSRSSRQRAGHPDEWVTMIGEPAASVLVVASRLDADSAARVLADLDHRERAGYERRQR